MNKRDSAGRLLKTEFKTSNGLGESGCDRRRSAALTSSRPVVKKKFFIAADITLLKAVLRLNPWENGSAAWLEVINELQEVHDFVTNSRQVSERCVFLIKKFREEKLTDINMKGTELEFKERATLCEFVSNMHATVNVGKMADCRTIEKMNHAEKAVGYCETDSASASCITPTIEEEDTETDNKDTPSDHHTLNNTALQSLDINDLLLKRALLDTEVMREKHRIRLEQHNADIEIRRRQLDLEERRLRLEEERFAADQRWHEEMLDEMRGQREIFLQMLWVMDGGSIPKTEIS